jgi:hypothetical protein
MTGGPPSRPINSAVTAMIGNVRISSVAATATSNARLASERSQLWRKPVP